MSDSQIKPCHYLKPITVPLMAVPRDISHIFCGTRVLFNTTISWSHAAPLSKQAMMWRLIRNWSTPFRSTTKNLKAMLTIYLRYMYLNELSYRILSRYFSEDLILVLLAKLFSSLTMCIANNTSHLNLM